MDDSMKKEETETVEAHNLNSKGNEPEISSHTHMVQHNRNRIALDLCFIRMLFIFRLNCNYIHTYWTDHNKWIIFYKWHTQKAKERNKIGENSFAWTVNIQAGSWKQKGEIVWIKIWVILICKKNTCHWSNCIIFFQLVYGS